MNVSRWPENNNEKRLVAGILWNVCAVEGCDHLCRNRGGKMCRAHESRDYYARNREKICAERRAVYPIKGREKNIERCRRKRQNASQVEKEYWKAYKRVWCDKHRERLAAKRRERYLREKLQRKGAEI